MFKQKGFLAWGVFFLLVSVFQFSFYYILKLFWGPIVIALHITPYSMATYFWFINLFPNMVVSYIAYIWTAKKFLVNA